MSYDVVLCEKDARESELQRTVEESKRREAYLENELANMWVLVAKLKKAQVTSVFVHLRINHQMNSDSCSIFICISNDVDRNHQMNSDSCSIFICIFNDVVTKHKRNSQQVSILVLQKYKSPVLVCAINEVLSSLAGEEISSMPSLIFPFILDLSKIKLEREVSVDDQL
ncbi:hypothetical protein L6452_33777 [Arctium lappa]|uniref:Uncharacterized protein n=1 Tax=Arctium lappa TaxID=4217 RepID=A0ACB8YGJ1_ARCLA|nr:hypothetical protein L6452_33777 [Arctium lappa]